MTNPRRILSLFFPALLFAVPLAEAQTAVLDGRAFLADVGEKGMDADEKGDVITFAGGKFHSSVCDQYGYSKGAYRSTAAGEAIAFEAQTLSEKDGRLVWKGTVRGEPAVGAHRDDGAH